ncbi:hypothetical protein LG202_01200 [Methylobacillus methanolivorans]
MRGSCDSGNYKIDNGNAKDQPFILFPCEWKQATRERLHSRTISISTNNGIAWWPS